MKRDFALCDVVAIPCGLLVGLLVTLFFSYAERQAMKPLSKLDIAAMDDTAGIANVINLRKPHELDAHVMPESERNSSGSMWVDFWSFWCVDLRLWLSSIDWLHVGYYASLALAIFAFLISFVGMAIDFDMVPDLTHVLDRFGLPN